MSEVSLEEVISEQAFAELLATASEMFFRLAGTLNSKNGDDWGRRHFFQLINESDDLEAFLDDYGARNNRTFSFLRELVASVRGFALTGFSVAHLERRMESYGTALSMTTDEVAASQGAIAEARAFVATSLRTLLEATTHEARKRNVALPADEFPVARYRPDIQRKQLPRNVGQEELEDEEQKIAEFASRYLEACEMLDRLNIRPIADQDQRETFLRRVCTEEQARVHEATVHNLQSAYDTYIKNTAIEARDDRLPRLRGHVSASLHILEAVTYLVHFVERHENGSCTESAERRIDELVDRAEVRRVTLNGLLFWANAFMQKGRPFAEELLPSYTNVQTLKVEIGDDMVLHARPAALIVAIVNQYGTPVEMEVDGTSCNAGSILELMVTVGSNPEAKRFVFRGDEHPLRDIGILFESRLGEDGVDKLPEELGYLH